MSQDEYVIRIMPRTGAKYEGFGSDGDSSSNSNSQQPGGFGGFSLSGVSSFFANIADSYSTFLTGEKSSEPTTSRNLFPNSGSNTTSNYAVKYDGFGSDGATNALSRLPQPASSAAAPSPLVKQSPSPTLSSQPFSLPSLPTLPTLPTLPGTGHPSSSSGMSVPKLPSSLQPAAKQPSPIPGIPTLQSSSGLIRDLPVQPASSAAESKSVSPIHQTSVALVKPASQIPSLAQPEDPSPSRASGLSPAKAAPSAQGASVSVHQSPITSASPTAGLEKDKEVPSNPSPEEPATSAQTTSSTSLGDDWDDFLADLK